jgi:signal transduction histidine kinase
VRPDRSQPKSLATTLIVRHTMAFGAMMLLWLTVYLAFSWDSYRQDFGGRLEDLARSISNSIVPGENGEASIRMSPNLVEALASIPSLRLAAWNPVSGAIIRGSDPELAHSLRSALSDDSHLFFKFHEQPALHGLFPSPSGPIEVVLVRGKVTVDDFVSWLTSTVTEEILPTLVPAMLITLAIGAYTVRGALAPLAHAAASVDRIGPADTSTRLDECHIPIEVLPFVRAVNQALDRLADALTAERRFTADAAHELRTPIAILGSRIDSLQTGETKRLLQLDVARAGRVINQLLSMSTLDAHAPDLVEGLNLVEVGREVVADLVPRALADDKEITFCSPGQPVNVTGNPVALGDALRNLIDNALRFTPRRESVDVSIHRDGTIEVSDRGPGVPTEHRHAVFQRFWRGPDPRGEGVGLGLAIVARIAEAHGAHITVDDNPDGGAKFKIKLKPAELAIAPREQAIPGSGEAA